MKKLLLWIFAFAQLSAGALMAQDITGSWQGTLHAGSRDLRVVLKVSKGDGNALKGVMYSIDQPGGQGVPISSVTLQNSTVKMVIPGLGGGYEGKLDSDGVNLNRNVDAGRAAAGVEFETGDGGDRVGDPEASIKDACGCKAGR